MRRSRDVRLRPTGAYLARPSLSLPSISAASSLQFPAYAHWTAGRLGGGYALAAMTLQSLIRTIPGHPRPGIQFRDITTLLRDPKGLRLAVDGIADRHRASGIDLVVGIEARGFIFGTAIAYALGLGFVPIRKPGKLPGEKIGRDFDLEYGSDRLELHVGAIEAGQKVLLVDDLIATGGTAGAALQLLRDVGAEVVECAFVVALPDLGGLARLDEMGCKAHWLCSFEGD